MPSASLVAIKTLRGCLPRVCPRVPRTVVTAGAHERTSCFPRRTRETLRHVKTQRLRRRLDFHLRLGAIKIRGRRSASAPDRPAPPLSFRISAVATFFSPLFFSLLWQGSFYVIIFLISPSLTLLSWHFSYFYHSSVVAFFKVIFVAVPLNVPCSHRLWF